LAQNKLKNDILMLLCWQIRTFPPAICNGMVNVPIIVIIPSLFVLCSGKTYEELVVQFCISWKMPTHDNG
jgi:hypothetical protein